MVNEQSPATSSEAPKPTRLEANSGSGPISTPQARAIATVNAWRRMHTCHGKCTTCGNAMPSVSYSPRLYKCDKCNLACLDLSELTKHMRSSHEDVFLCRFCQMPCTKPEEHYQKCTNLHWPSKASGTSNATLSRPTPRRTGQLYSLFRGLGQSFSSSVDPKDKLEVLWSQKVFITNLKPFSTSLTIDAQKCSKILAVVVSAAIEEVEIVVTTPDKRKLLLDSEGIELKPEAKEINCLVDITQSGVLMFKLRLAFEKPINSPPIEAILTILNKIEANKTAIQDQSDKDKSQHKSDDKPWLTVMLDPRKVQDKKQTIPKITSGFTISTETNKQTSNETSDQTVPQTSDKDLNQYSDQTPMETSSETPVESKPTNSLSPLQKELNDINLATEELLRTAKGLDRSTEALDRPTEIKCQWKDCTETLTDKSALRAHILLNHPMKGKERNYICHWNSCQQKFKSISEVRCHLSSHFEDNLFPSQDSGNL